MMPNMVPASARNNPRMQTTLVLRCTTPHRVRSGDVACAGHVPALCALPRRSLLPALGRPRCAPLADSGLR
eukprot:2763344-Rhodomonas_salina.2